VLREGLIDYLSPDFLVGECVLQRSHKIIVLRPFVITQADDQERIAGPADAGNSMPSVVAGVTFKERWAEWW